MPDLSKWKLLSNSYATFNLETVTLLSNPNINPKNGVTYKKNLYWEFVLSFIF